MTFADLYLMQPVEMVCPDSGTLTSLTILEGHYLRYAEGKWYFRCSLGYGYGGAVRGKGWHRLTSDDSDLNMIVPDSNIRTIIERTD